MAQELAVYRVLSPIRMCDGESAAEERSCRHAHLDGQLKARDWREPSEDLRLDLGRLGEGIGAVARKGHEERVTRNASQGTVVEPKVPFQRSCCQSAGSGTADARSLA